MPFVYICKSAKAGVTGNCPLKNKCKPKVCPLWGGKETFQLQFTFIRESPQLELLWYFIFALLQDKHEPDKRKEERNANKLVFLLHA